MRTRDPPGKSGSGTWSRGGLERRLELDHVGPAKCLLLAGTAGPLRRVERTIGAADEALRGARQLFLADGDLLLALLGHQGPDTDAEADRDLVPFVLENGGCRTFEEPVRHDERAGGRRIGQNDHELVAAVAPNDVGL